MNRRVFIKRTLAAGALIAGSSSLLNACGSGVKRSDLQPEGREFETVPSLGEEASAILYYASLAPSGHNAQPWVVKVSPQREWVVGGDPKRRLPAVEGATYTCLPERKFPSCKTDCVTESTSDMRCIAGLRKLSPLRPSLGKRCAARTRSDCGKPSG